MNASVRVENRFSPLLYIIHLTLKPYTDIYRDAASVSDLMSSLIFVYKASTKVRQRRKKMETLTSKIMIHERSKKKIALLTASYDNQKNELTRERALAFWVNKTFQ